MAGLAIVVAACGAAGDDAPTPGTPADDAGAAADGPVGVADDAAADAGSSDATANDANASDATPDGGSGNAIGPAGGTVSLGGARIVIPQGALAASTIITLSARPTPSQAELGAAPMGPGIRATPDGLTFLKPVEVHLPYVASMLPPGVSASSVHVRMAPQGTNDFAALSSEVDEVTSTVVARTTHFTDFVPAAPLDAAPPLLITSVSPLPPATRGKSYTHSFDATGGVPPYTWTLSAGASLPPGLALATSGSLSGTPTTNGQASFFVTVTDAAASAVQAAFALSVSGTNEVPILEVVSPSTVAYDGASLVLSIAGSKFGPDARVVIDETTDLAVTFIDDGHLSAELPTTRFGWVGNHTIKVINPPVGGGTSAGKTFTVTNRAQIPDLTSVSPATIAVGSIATQVVATARLVTPDTVITIGTQALPSVMVSAQSVAASIPASYFAAPGSLVVHVHTPLPAGGYSVSSAIVTVGSPTDLPTLDSVSPTSMSPGAPAFTIDLAGTGFQPGAAIYFGPTALPTTVHSATSATATVPTALLPLESVHVRIVNPSPSGASNARTFVVRPTDVPWASLDTSSVNSFCGRTATNALYCTGWSADMRERLFPRPVENALAFDAVSVGYGHVCGIAAEQLYCWGSNENGQAGVTSSVPAPLFVGTPMKAVAAARAHTCALSTTGALRCWGGRFGPGVRIIGGTYKAISSDVDIVCGIDATDQARCFGDNAAFFGNLAGPKLTKISAGAGGACGLRADGKAYCWTGSNTTCRGGTSGVQPTPVDITPPGVTFTDISFACQGSCARATSGAIYCWGNNGVLGNGTGAGTAISPVVVPGLPSMTSVVVARGGNAACGLSTTGERWCWGDNTSGMLGNGTRDKALSPIHVP